MIAKFSEITNQMIPVILNRKPLRFLVLDEIHTYSGNTGGDVACLIRRVKQHLHIKNPICIGTSATIDDKSGSYLIIN